MICYRIVVVFVLFSSFIYGQLGPCNTPDGKRGQCKSIYNCQPLLTVANNVTSAEDTELLKKSHCGFDGNVPAVCCPEEPLQCTTPDGQPGKCISLYSCPDLSKLLTPPVPDDKLQFVSLSKCNGPDEYSVCCGPAPTFRDAKPVTSSCASSVTAFPPDPKSECCGIDSNVANKIVGGLPTTIDQYPWLAIIEYMKDGLTRTMCGGALISGKYVLTAGHCVTGAILNHGTPRNIILGEYDKNNEGPDCVTVAAGGIDCTEGITKIPIEKTIPHPQYDPYHSNRWHDIALIRMRKMAPFTDFIRPICLPSVDMTLRSDPFNMTAAGWGATSRTERSNPVKLHVELPFVTQQKCQPAYDIPSLKITLSKGQLCAGGVKGKDTCKGDSGGPLMFENDVRLHVAVGVVSFGHTDCGTENVPGIYTNVYEYDSWIRSTITS